MIIENKRAAGKIKILFLLIPIIFVLIITAAIVNNFIGYTFLIILAIIFILIVAFLSYLKLYYVDFNNEENKITMKYHSLGPVGVSYKTMIIPQKFLAKFEIKKSFFGIKKDIYFYQKVKSGIAKYPPLSITLFSKKEILKLELLLKGKQ
ncbi:MAG: hypothetical protein KAT68_02315 [Bacteroidales bacterium]|nr:hypothetical protein [Bacteroidales bacterium]